MSTTYTKRHCIETPWGLANVDEETLDDLASFTGHNQKTCLEQLRGHHYGRLAEEWSQAQPQTAEEMRLFYGHTDAYLWGLTLYHASPMSFYAKIVRDMTQPDYFRALDYGSGIGNTALQLAELGYHVTLADVPGISFRYAQHRLARRGYSFSAIPITTDQPPLEGRYDLICCFDVLEHVQQPDAVFRHLARHLAPKGKLGLVVAFDAQEGHEGYHLKEGYRRWGGDRWGMFVSGQGFATRNLIYWRDSLPRRMVRRARYGLWRTTGLQLKYLPKTVF